MEKAREPENIQNLETNVLKNQALSSIKLLVTMNQQTNKRANENEKCLDCTKPYKSGDSDAINTIILHTVYVVRINTE